MGTPTHLCSFSKVKENDPEMKTTYHTVSILSTSDRFNVLQLKYSRMMYSSFVLLCIAFYLNIFEDLTLVFQPLF